MPMRTALQRCPSAIRVSPRFDRYHELSRRVMEIFRQVTDLVEPLSLDEAYLDVTESVSADRPPAAIAEELRTQVRSALSLTISVGVATSKSVAKIASDMDKPDGLTVVAPGAERDFLAPLAVTKLSGIGPKTAARLARDGVRTIGDLASRSDGWLARRFGRTGSYMRRLALGQDNRPVEVRRERKSVSAETTLARDTDDADLLLSLVDRLSRQVGGYLESKDVRGRTVRVKLRLADFTTFTRQTTTPQPVGSSDAVALAARDLVQRELQPGRLFRLVGVGVTGFPPADERPEQPRLTGFE
jgi:DNA polymerase-4